MFKNIFIFQKLNKLCIHLNQTSKSLGIDGRDWEIYLFTLFKLQKINGPLRNISKEKNLSNKISKKKKKNQKERNISSKNANLF